MFLDKYIFFAGSGASCVYGLLGAKQNGWHFLATEADVKNYETARKNVENNNMSKNILGKNNRCSFLKYIISYEDKMI